ncbi:hypothetical protein KD913_17515 [Klebsiella pneumoniae]
MSLRQQAQRVQARWPVANGGINDEFIQLFFRLQRVKPGFNLFRSTGDQRRFTAGNARRSAAGPRAKATACASLPTVTRWPFSSSTPHTSTCCASAAAVAGSSATTTGRRPSPHAG